MRVTNQQHPEGEGIQEIHPRLAEFLENAGIEVTEDDRVFFPEQTDEEFVVRIVTALNNAFLGPAPLPPEQHVVQSSYDTFRSKCGPCNQELVRRVRDRFYELCTWGTCTMSIGPKNEPKGAYIHNKESKNGEMTVLKPAFLAILKAKNADFTGLDLQPNGQIRIPEAIDNEFIERIIAILTIGFGLEPPDGTVPPLPVDP
jgi:hypothetical protein